MHLNKRSTLLQKAPYYTKEISFSDFKTLLKQQGWVFSRQAGSHEIWHSSQGMRLVIQNNGGKAKGYQLKQFLLQWSKEQEGTV